MIKTKNLHILRSAENLFVKRIFGVQREIQKIGEKLHIPDQIIAQIRLQASSNNKIFDMPRVEKRGDSFTIHLPTMFFIETEDFITNPYLSKKLFTTLQNQNLSIKEQCYIEVFKEFIVDPSLSRDGKTFTLAHELSHIALGHLSMNNSKSRPSKESLQREKEADLLAAENVPGAARGGVYLFRILDKHLPKEISSTHPIPGDRISYLEKVFLRDILVPPLF